MVKESEPCAGLEWRINMHDGTSKVLVPDCVSKSRVWRRLEEFFVGIISKIWGFFQRAWKLAVNEPKKVMHCVKVGIALSLVSIFYYMRPLYEGVGGNAMWAIMTVVVVFEYTVGATLSKCVNRTAGTFLAGALGVGVHWIASRSGEKFEPIILQGSVFLLAAAATFSRFIPSIKARFDYGAMIFILTFSLVSVSGYRVENLFELAHNRLSTIAIGTSICILTSMLVWPVWAGTELHNLIKNNTEKLSDSLDGCVSDYFGNDVKANNNKSEESNKILQGYKCALNSKATEEALANFARWEPSHGGFNFGHPWKEYLKVGASLRSCAYCIEALNGSMSSDNKAPDFLKKHFSKFCIRLSAKSSAVMKELAVSISTMTKSSKIDHMVGEMRNAVEELQNVLKSLSKQTISSTEPKIGDSDMGEGNVSPTVVALVEVVPLVTVSSLLIEIAARTEKIAKAVNGLADKAEFRAESADKMKKNQNQEVLNTSSAENEEDKTIMACQKV
ncbi:putative membrane protein [Handroanthus impetiginosus]|uniref:Putative membrane protein n=1 Tax=Handroanthus impetiginosus TaxID=429701 RepID=A0A2G9I466_9LAMI|nr:putative membrane protein [Handroanthus impetiginosus]